METSTNTCKQVSGLIPLRKTSGSRSFFWNTDTLTYSDIPASGALEPWPIVNGQDSVDFSDSSPAEGTVNNDIQRVESKSDSSLTLDMNKSKQTARNSIPSTLGSGCQVSDRGQVSSHFSKFPTEVYETIIDYVAKLCYKGRWRDLANCALVSRAWVPRAQMHLFSSIHFEHKDSVISFQYAVRRKPFLLQYIISFQADYYNIIPRPTTLLTSYFMRNLKQCCILSLDLRTAHSSLSRFPSLATSLQLLEIHGWMNGDVNQLCRFLVSFRSLTMLTIAWSNRTPFRGLDLPHLHLSCSKSSLRALIIRFKPHISRVLQFLIKARPFVTHLKHFIIAWDYRRDISSTPVQEITELLQHCSRSLEEVTVIFGPCPGLIRSWESLYSLTLLVGLNSTMAQHEQRLFLDDARRLDDLLAGEMFRSFRKLQIRTKLLEPIEFPKLKARKVEVNISGECGYISFGMSL
ncbi:hypothetical protein QCA50_013510 [Cerrena zonata]|uniref:F-box domain-containing protein n=1 Tax=Cerrena zonata TaxID=2478898 RepID=A0AAW0FQB2_9APHY